MRDLDGLTVEEQRDYWEGSFQQASVAACRAVYDNLEAEQLLRDAVGSLLALVDGPQSSDYYQSKVDADGIIVAIHKYFGGE